MKNGQAKVSKRLTVEVERQVQKGNLFVALSVISALPDKSHAACVTVGGYFASAEEARAFQTGVADSLVVATDPEALVEPPKKLILPS
jgi:hypothetical protein